MKRLIIIALLAIVAGTAGAKKAPEQSYNLQRGIEAANNEQYGDAMEYILRDLNDHPNNGEALVWGAYCRLNQEKYDLALNNASRAIRHLPKSDKVNLSWAYRIRYKVELELGDSAAALQDIAQAEKINPKNYEWIADHGYLLFMLNRYDEAIAAFRRVLDIYPGETYSHFMIGSCRFYQERYEEAIERYNYVLRLDPSHARALSFRAQCEHKLGRYEDATDDLIASLDCDLQGKAVRVLYANLDREAADMLVLKLEAKAAAHPNSFGWQYNAAVLLHKQNRLTEAIAAYKKAAEIYPYTWLNQFIAECYSRQGDPRHAISYFDKAIEADSTDVQYYELRAQELEALKEYDAALSDIEHVLSDYPEYGSAHASKGRLLYKAGRTEEALSAFIAAATFDPKDPTAFQWQALTKLLLGDTAKVERLFRRAIAVDSVAKAGYAGICYAYLGERENALRADSLAAHTYNSACVYAVLGEADKAIDKLERHIEDGNVNTAWIRTDPDLKSLQDNPRLIALLDSVDRVLEERYRANAIIEGDSVEEVSDSAEYRVVEVPFSPAGGVTKVNCSINDLPLSFIFDTGCSDVTISEVEANFMFKNGYLEARDIQGSQRFRTADGSIGIGTTINLRKINFGGLELKDVRASVVANQKAPLLLGQSVLQRLGKIEIDNKEKVLRISVRE